MSVRFILGRAGTGKTRHCLDAILAEHDAPTHDRALLLLVPEQASFQMERELALRSTNRGFSRAEVLSFSRMARRTLNLLGGECEEITPQGRVLALRAVAAQSDESVRAFGPAARTEGFFRRLSRLLEELLNEAVGVNQLRAALERISDARTRARMQAIATLLERYLAVLGTQRLDPALRLERLRTRLLEATWLDGCQIWVDGFAGFTGQELATLAALATRARTVEITLLLDPDDYSRKERSNIPPELRLFHRTEQTYQRLCTMLRDQGAQIADPLLLNNSAAPPRYRNAAGLAKLESRLASASVRSADEFAASSEIRVLSCESHREELIQAARFIRQSVIDSGGALQYRDFAIIARDLEPFARLVAEVLDDYEIPYFLDRRRPLGGHPLPRVVASLLAAASRDCPLPMMLRILRSGLMPFSRDRCERIENQAIAREIRGRDAWRMATWDFQYQQGTGGHELDTDRSMLMSAMQPLFAADSSEKRSARGWCIALYEVLEQLNIRQALERWMVEATEARELEAAETHRLAWESLCEILDDISRILADQPLLSGDFAAILDGALAETTLGLAPPTVNQVLVSSIERSRHPEIKFAWLFAFNEGIFPARPPDDAILTETERELLQGAGLAAPSPAREDAFAERMLAYIAVTRPSRGLSISFARVGNSASEQFPSPLLRSILQSIPGLTVQEAERDAPVLTERELAAAILNERTAARGQSVLDRMAEEKSKLRVQWLLRGREYSNSPPTLRADLRRTKGGYKEEGKPEIVWTGSPSEIETFVQCPFQHLSKYRLRLESMRGPTPVEWELGTLAHAVLASATKQAIDATAEIRRVSDVQWDEWFERAWEMQEHAEGNGPATSSAQLQTLKHALKPFVREVLLAQAHRWRRGAFEPLAAEQRFGGYEQGEMAGLEMNLPQVGRIRVRGSIDRVDGCEIDGRLHLLIYDYKPFAPSLARRFLTGMRLQAFLYLLAVEQSWGADANVVTAGALISPLYPRAQALETAYVKTAPRDVQRMYLYLPRGLFQAAIAGSLDKQLGTVPSPIANMQQKKDGGLYSRSDAKAAEAVTGRLDLARETLRRTALGVTGGCVDIAPLVEAKTMACKTCDFWTLCRFEPTFNRPRVAERSLPILPSTKGGESA